MLSLLYVAGASLTQCSFAFPQLQLNINLHFSLQLLLLENTLVQGATKKIHSWSLKKKLFDAPDLLRSVSTGYIENLVPEWFLPAPV